MTQHDLLVILEITNNQKPQPLISGHVFKIFPHKKVPRFAELGMVTETTHFKTGQGPNKMALDHLGSRVGKSSQRY